MLLMGSSRMGRSRNLILAALGDHKPRSLREIVRATGLSKSAAYDSLFICWERGLALRTKEPLYEHERIFRGRVE